jgi:hypothetical protein
MRRMLLVLLGVITGTMTFLILASHAGGIPELPSSGRYTTLPFDDLRNWTYIPGKTSIPESIMAFDGKPVQMAGFMMPLTQAKEVTEFLLVPYLWGCCFGAPPAPNHMVLVDMAAGKTTEFLNVPVCIRGTFHAGEIRRDGALISLYRLDADEVGGR